MPLAGVRSGPRRVGSRPASGGGAEGPRRDLDPNLKGGLEGGDAAREIAGEATGELDGVGVGQRVIRVGDDAEAVLEIEEEAVELGDRRAACAGRGEAADVVVDAVGEKAPVDSSSPGSSSTVMEPSSSSTHRDDPSGGLAPPLSSALAPPAATGWRLGGWAAAMAAAHATSFSPAQGTRRLR